MALKQVSTQEVFSGSESLSQEAEMLKKGAKNILGALVGFGFSQLECMGSMSPFTCGFLAAAPFEFCFSAFCGSTVGYLIRFTYPLSLRHILSLFILCLIRVLISKKYSSFETGRFKGIAAFVTVITASLLFDFSFTGALSALLEASLCFCSWYFYSRSLKTPLMRIGLTRLSISDSLSLALSFCSLILSLDGISIEGFSPARLISFFILCVVGFSKGAPGGAVAGICLAAAVGMRPEASFVFPALSLAGIIGGVFSYAGQIATGVSFALSFFAVCFIAGGSSGILLPIIECIIAASAFMVLPAPWLFKIKDTVNKASQSESCEVNLQVAEVLKKASENIGSFCETVTAVSDNLDRIINPEVNKLFFELQQKVCDSCSQKPSCWNRNFDETAADVLVILGTQKKQKTKVPLEKRCSRLPELRRYIIASRTQHSMNMVSKMKNREMRKLLTEQFSAMGDFLGELSVQFEKSRVPDREKSSLIRGELIERGIYVDMLSCFCEGDNGLLVEMICLEKPYETEYRKIQSIIEDVTGRAFEKPLISESESGTMLKFEEKSIFELIVGSAQRSLAPDGPCGDSLALYCHNGGRHSVILSDGMGTGSSAFIDSSMTVSLLEKLISCGFSFESAVKIVNSSLIIKSTDESMATVDGISVNLFNGKCDFYKAGAALSYFRRGMNVYTLEESSLPLGILRGVSFEKNEKQLEVGDIILLLSDGVTAGDCGWICDELLSWSTNNMDDLALHIVELAALRQDRQNGDDLTAVAVKLVRRRC